MKRDEIIKKAYELFGSFEKPVLLTCSNESDTDPESKDHDNSLKHTTCKTLSISQLGSVGYSPVPNFNSQAMAYFLPRLIEFAVQNVSDIDNDPYAIRFINSMLGGPHDKQFKLLNSEQRQIVYQALMHVKNNFYGIIETECWEDDLEVALAKWKTKDF